MPKSFALAAALALGLAGALPAAARDNAPDSGGTCSCLCLAGTVSDTLDVPSRGFGCAMFNGKHCSVYNPQFRVYDSGRTDLCHLRDDGPQARVEPLLDADVQVEPLLLEQAPTTGLIGQ